MTKTIDLAELQIAVTDTWENEGIPYFYYDNVGFISPDPEKLEMFIKPEYQEILNSPTLCLTELGYSKMSDYLRDQKEPTNKVKKENTVYHSSMREEGGGVKIGYFLISKTRTKFFFEHNGKDLEFYIDRNPETSTADLWMRPGNTDGGLQFICALLNELERARI